jgi:aldose 1-epimerase
MLINTFAGRVANRIANGKFSLPRNDSSIEYTLSCNNPPNHLHGGPGGFHSKFWNIIEKKIFHGNGEKAARDDDVEYYSSVTFEYLSPDMEEGYPGFTFILLLYLSNSDLKYFQEL